MTQKSVMRPLFCCLIMLMTSCVTSQMKPVQNTLYQDAFNGTLDQWVIETPENPDSKVEIQDGKLLIDVADGCTVWFKEKLSGNYSIEFDRTVVMDGSKNERLTDFNFFWMATDPENENLFTRTGVFRQYHPLSLYYVGFGGNDNKTTRFRKYMGDGERRLLQEHLDEAHLLKANQTYHVKITVNDGLTQVFVDGEKYFAFKDGQPLTEGYFGFRTVRSKQTVDNFAVSKIK